MSPLPIKIIGEERLVLTVAGHADRYSVVATVTAIGYWVATHA